MSRFSLLLLSTFFLCYHRFSMLGMLFNLLACHPHPVPVHEIPRRGLPKRDISETRALSPWSASLPSEQQRQKSEIFQCVKCSLSPGHVAMQGPAQQLIKQMTHTHKIKMKKVLSHFLNWWISSEVIICLSFNDPWYLHKWTMCAWGTWLLTSCLCRMTSRMPVCSLSWFCIEEGNLVLTVASEYVWTLLRKKKG